MPAHFTEKRTLAMPLSCPQCGQSVLAEDVELSTQLAKCRACHTVFSFRRQVEQLDTSDSYEFEDERPRTRHPVPQPQRFRVDDYGATFQVRWRWFTWEVLFLTVFCAFWDGFLLLWFTAGIAAGGPWIMFVFPIVHVAVGVVLTYLVLAIYLNATTVRLASGQMTVHHGPLPWRGNVSRSTHDVQQLFVRDRMVASKKSRRIEYDLLALLADGSELLLVRGLREPHEALYLEQELEQRLKIKDEPVDGELER